MAMTKDELDSIKLGVNKAKKRAMAFGFAKTRKDGGKDPLLEIQLTESLAKKAIKSNGAPPLMWGSLEMLDKQTIAFVVDHGKPAEIRKAVSRNLKKAHPILAKAKVFTRTDFDAEQAANGGPVDSPPEAFEAKIINCWEPDGDSWTMILTGGVKQGIVKNMKAVVDYLGQSCVGKVIDVYPTRCKIRVEAPTVGNTSFLQRDFERIVLGARAKGRYPSPSAAKADAKPVARNYKAKMISYTDQGRSTWTMILNHGEAHGVEIKTPVVINYGSDTPQSVKGHVIDVYPTRCKAKVRKPLLASHETFSLKMVESVFIGSSAKGQYASPAKVKKQREKEQADREAAEAAAAQKLEKELAKADPQHAKFETLMRSYRGIENGDARAMQKWMRQLQAYVKARKVPRPRGYDGAEQVLFNLRAEQTFIESVFERSQENPHDDDEYAAFLNALARAYKALPVYERFVGRARKHMQKFSR